MRRWIKGLAVGGVVGAALSVGLAGEQLANRREPSTKKPSRLGQQEFFSRNHSGDLEADAPVDPEIVQLAADASSTPKRFTRQKPATSVPTVANKRPAQRDLESELFGDESDEAAPVAKPSSRYSKSNYEQSSSASARRSTKANMPTLTPINEDDVELLPSSPELKLTGTQPVRRSSGKQVAHEIPRAGFAEGSTAPTKRSLTPVTTFDDADEDGGIVAADYQQRPGNQSNIQQVRAESISPRLSRAEPAILNPPQKSNRVSVITDRSPKPGTSANGRAIRTASSGARDSSGFSNGTPSVSAEWVKRGEINVGQECVCDLVVKNNGRVIAREVIVEAFFPASVRLTQSDPAPSEATDHLEWAFAELSPGEERIINLTMVPTQRGDLAMNANVRFTGTAANVFKVEEPLLKVTTQAPADVVVGDPLVQIVTVTNPGTGVAQNVRIQVATSNGLEHSRSDRSQIEIGALSPGESRTVRLSFTATEGGEQSLEVEATADSGLSQVAESTVHVIAPSLKVAIDGPSLRYVGRDSRFTLTVKNDGQAATNNVRVSHRVPNGFKFLKADKGGTLEASQGIVSWFVGHLEPNQSVQLKLHLQATELGEFEHQVRATSEHGIVAKAGTTTKIEGSASLVLEIHDLDDPVEVGQPTAYEVRVSNSGTKEAEKVGLVFELPSGLELIDVQSPTQHLVKSGLILFNDLPILPPGKTALYRIQVRGQSEGNLRVRARLTSESIDQDLISEELTKFYGE